ncbi:MAG TPA: DinB family protein [Thermoanaerobaculia bacterium]|nr:DinB family protein [Thermoanaerobaculia bacterium]
MNVRELFVKQWNTEEPKFGKVLRAVPPEPLSYRPHERSPSAGELAWQLAQEQRVLNEMLDKGEVRWEMKRRPHPATLEEIVEAWDRYTESLRTKLAAIDDAKWDGSVVFYIDGNEGGRGTVGEYLWGFLHDMIHHRGQLTVYIRPMGGKVPGIYGPSGDEMPT